MDILTESTYRPPSRAALVARIRAATLTLQAARLRHMLEVRRFNPDQPRIPAGYRFGGRWVGEGDDFGPSAAGDAPSLSVLPASHEGDGLPSLPEERPASGRARHRIARDLFRYLASDANVTVRLAILALRFAWLADQAARDIIAYLDRPKPLDELRAAVQDPKPGYDIHHIVEATPARRDGFSNAMIESPENKVRIPRFRHWEITGWYAAKSKEYGGLSPREYLRGRSWEERMRVGIEALIRHGVLEP